jgi:hypothetical protein
MELADMSAKTKVRSWVLTRHKLSGIYTLHADGCAHQDAIAEAAGRGELTAQTVDADALDRLVSADAYSVGGGTMLNKASCIDPAER